MYYAHSGEKWEPLRDHLQDVADCAALFAAPFGAAEEARLAGLLHDLGKYSDRFTARLKGEVRGLDHWSAGAWAALANLQRLGTAAALAIQGHHVGLQSPGSLRELGNLARYQHPLGRSLTDTDGQALLARLAEDGLSLPRPEQSLFDLKSPRAAGMLDVRMLFSALVDADFIETEAHFQRDPDGNKVHRPSGPPLQALRALRLLDDHMAKLAAKTRAAEAVAKVRTDLLQACQEAATLPQGLFTLSAPTGAGKTLAMLASKGLITIHRPLSSSSTKGSTPRPRSASAKPCSAAPRLTNSSTSSR